MAGTDRLYPYRIKFDGSSDSICLRCFRTVRGSNPASLAENERLHIWEPSGVLPLETRRYTKPEPAQLS